jgi:Ca2+-binding RTX toxin-like protein
LPYSGGDGHDTIIGGHNRPRLSDGDDTLYGGSGHDAILGDNGDISSTLMATPIPTCMSWPLSSMWLQYNNGIDNDGPIRIIVPFDVDENSTSYGHDLIHGDDGDDRLYGGNGNDTLNGNDGDDEVIGGGHHDFINGGSGDDICIGDWSQSYRSRSLDNRSWRWSLVSEDRVVIHDARALSYQLDSEWPDAEWWMRYDMYTVGSFSSIALPERPRVYIVAVQLDLGGHDNINGGDGNDVCIGGSGDDVIDGNSGHDIIVGDHMTTPSALINSSMTTSAIVFPTIFRAIRYVASSFSEDDQLRALTVPSFVNATFGTSLFVDQYISSHETTSPLPSVNNIGSWQSSTLHHLVAVIPCLVTSVSIDDTSSTWRPNIALYGHVIQHSGTQYGNDKLYGGHGNDIVVGDSLMATTWTATYDHLIDSANQRVASLSSSLSFRMSVLAHIQHSMNQSLCAGTSRNLRVASDFVDGNNGIDVAVGDNMFLPSIAPTFWAITTDQSSSELSSQYNDITIVEMVLIMVDAAVSVAQQQVTRLPLL